MFSAPNVATATSSASGYPLAGGQQGAANGLEQLFAQLMQQIQAGLEPGGEGGLMLPLDGEALPQELLAELGDFAEQLQAELTPELQQQLDDLVQQLTDEGVAGEQLLQLGQAALLARDEQLQRQEQPDSLLQLVDVIRAAQTEADAQGQQRSMEQLLALAERMRAQKSSALEEEAESVADELVNPAGSVAKGDLAAPIVTSDGDKAALLADKQADSKERVSPVAAPSERAVPEVAAAAERGAERAAVELKATATIPRPAESLRSVAPRAAGEAESVSLAGRADQRADARAEQAMNAAEADAEGQQRQDGKREQGLARWVELRDSVFAQGQRLASNEALFKTTMASQLVAESEPLSLIQASRNAASLVQLQQAYQPPTTPQAAGQGLALGERFGSERWLPAASQRIVWMAGQQFSTAEIRLDPPELGSLNIRLHISGDQASLSFTSPHAQVREVLEQQMPRLKEMLAESGIDLGQADVSDQTSSQEAEQQDSSAGAVAAESEEQELQGPDEVAASQGQLALSLVDYYA